MHTNVEPCVSGYSAGDPYSALLRSADMRKIPRMTRDAHPVQEIRKFENPIVFGFPQILQLRSGFQELSEERGKLRTVLV